MKFDIEQRYAAEADAVARAYTDPELYDSFDGLGKLTKPEVVSQEVDGDLVVLEIRYGFNGDLSPAARAVIDPSRLTWIERSTHDLADCSASFIMLPDHYADRFRCEGTYRFEPAEGGCLRVGRGDLRVRALLVAGAVEGAIVSGLREHLVDEVPLVEAFLSR